MRRSHASTIRFSVPPGLAHGYTTLLPAQDNISHPSPEREVVLRTDLGVEARDLGDELDISAGQYLRISSVVALGSPSGSLLPAIVQCSLRLR